LGGKDGGGLAAFAVRAKAGGGCEYGDPVTGAGRYRLRRVRAFRRSYRRNRAAAPSCRHPVIPSSRRTIVPSGAPTGASRLRLLLRAIAASAPVGAAEAANGGGSAFGNAHRPS